LSAAYPAVVSSRGIIKLVSVSPQFFGWITALGPGVRIDGPTDVREEYLKFLKQAMGLYQEEP
jgi:hypothetical protein